MRMPDDLAHLQNDELVTRLGRLTQQQINGIARIIAAGYVTEAYICPRHLLYGAGRICNSEMMYRTGKWDDERQRWRVSPGWARQPAFLEALNLAKQLARRYNVDEEYTAIAQANRNARLASPTIMQEMIAIARGLAFTESTVVPVDIAHRDRITAATLVLRYAALDAIPDDDHDNPEADWWHAAEEDA